MSKPVLPELKSIQLSLGGKKLRGAVLDYDIGAGRIFIFEGTWESRPEPKPIKPTNVEFNDKKRATE